MVENLVLKLKLPNQHGCLEKKGIIKTLNRCIVIVYIIDTRDVWSRKNYQTKRIIYKITALIYKHTYLS